MAYNNINYHDGTNEFFRLLMRHFSFIVDVLLVYNEGGSFPLCCVGPHANENPNMKTKQSVSS